MADGRVVIQVDMNGDRAQSGISKLRGLLGGLSDTGTKVGSVFKSVLGAALRYIFDKPIIPQKGGKK